MRCLFLFLLVTLVLSAAATAQDNQPPTQPAPTTAPSMATPPTPEPSTTKNDEKTNTPPISDSKAGSKPPVGTGDTDKPSIFDSCWKWLDDNKDQLSGLSAIIALGVSTISLFISGWLARRTMASMRQQAKVMVEQTTAQMHTLRLQAELAQLSQVKLRLETLLRGDSMRLGEQAVPLSSTPTVPLSSEQQQWVNLLVHQICGESHSKEHEALVKNLTTDWVQMEGNMQQAYEDVKKTLARRQAAET